MVLFHMLGMLSYSCAVVTLSLRCFPDIRLQKMSDVVTLKPGLGSVKVTENITMR